MNPQTELEARYPGADFSVYFRFLASACCSEKTSDTNEHHICPKKQFPEFIDALENVMTLRVDDHAFAHKLLEAACGIKAPSAHWFEIQRTAAALGGRKGGRVSGLENKQSRRGCFAHGMQSKGGKVSGCTTHKRKIGIFALETLNEYKRLGGRAQGNKNKANRTGIFSQGIQAKGAAVRNHTRWHVLRNIVKSDCSLCAAAAVTVP